MSTATEQITVGIKTFLRTDRLKLCLESLTRHQWQEVIVADDGEIDEEREAMYEHYQSVLPFKLLRLEFDTGLAAGRNEILKHCNSEYILMLDDDQTVPDNIGDLKNILDEDPSLGGVSGIWIENNEKTCQAYCLKLKGKDVIREYTKKDDRNNPTLYTSKGIRYKIFDFIPNSTLFRMACLNDITWDPFYKIDREHIDFYLMHKKAGRWKFAVAPDVEIGHHPQNNSSKYMGYRTGKRMERSQKYFLEKFDLNAVLVGGKYIEEPKSLKELYVLLKRKLIITLKHGFNR